VKQLLTSGANVNVRDKRGWSALFLACILGRSDIAKLLLEHGADANTKGKLRTQNAYWSVLMTASSKGHKEIVELLLKKGADLHTKDHKGCNAFQAAKEKGHAEIVEILRTHGAR
jgi:ankyrin repeat protein